MASSESMDDSFTARVDKIFGSLCPTSQLATSWSLTNHGVEKERNIRSKDKSNRDDETPCSSSFEGLFSKDQTTIRKELEELSDDDHSGISSYRHRGDGDDKDECDVRSSIGLDRTLDYEEEEDEHDRLAEGREDTGDRLFMRDIRDEVLSLSSHNVLPRLTHCGDLLANHFAAPIRLKEDEAGAERLDSSEKLMANDEPPCNRESMDDHTLKSILKKKHNAAAKSKKQVKFDLSCNKYFEEGAKEDQNIFTEASVAEIEFSIDESAAAKRRDRVPDYLIHPSKYTRYSFDSSHGTDKESGNKACMEFVGQTGKSKPTFMEGESVDLPTSVTFIPRRKANSSKTVNDIIEIKNKPQVTFAVGIAAGESQQSEVVMMEEDEPELDKSDKSEGFQKSGRHYRTKSRPEDPIS